MKKSNSFQVTERTHLLIQNKKKYEKLQRARDILMIIWPK